MGVGRQESSLYGKSSASNSVNSARLRAKRCPHDYESNDQRWICLQRPIWSSHRRRTNPGGHLIRPLSKHARERSARQVNAQQRTPGSQLGNVMVAHKNRMIDKRIKAREGTFEDIKVIVIASRRIIPTTPSGRSSRAVRARQFFPHGRDP